MAVTFKKFILVNSLAFFLAGPVFQTVGQAMVNDSSDEEQSDDDMKEIRAIFKKMDQARLEKEEKETALQIKHGTTNKNDIALGELLIPFGLQFKLSSLWSEGFDTLEEAARAFELKGKYTEAAQVWQAMTVYADAIKDSSSRYYASYGVILDFGACMSAEQSKQKQIRNSKKMGFRNAAESYSRANAYSEAVKMWNQLEAYMYEIRESLTTEEANKAALARRLEKSSKGKSH